MNLGNNLYGRAMLQYMPYGKFERVEPTLNGHEDLKNTSEIGIRLYPIVEVDT